LAQLRALIDPSNRLSS